MLNYEIQNDTLIIEILNELDLDISERRDSIIEAKPMLEKFTISTDPADISKSILSSQTPNIQGFQASNSVNPTQSALIEKRETRFSLTAVSVYIKNSSVSFDSILCHIREAMVEKSILVFLLPPSLDVTVECHSSFISLSTVQQNYFKTDFDFQLYDSVLHLDCTLPEGSFASATITKCNLKSSELFLADSNSNILINNMPISTAAVKCQLKPTSMMYLMGNRVHKPGKIDFSDFIYNLLNSKIFTLQGSRVSLYSPYRPTVFYTGLTGVLSLSSKGRVEDFLSTSKLYNVCNKYVELLVSNISTDPIKDNYVHIKQDEDNSYKINFNLSLTLSLFGSEDIINKIAYLCSNNAIKSRMCMKFILDRYFSREVKKGVYVRLNSGVLDILCSNLLISDKIIGKDLSNYCQSRHAKGTFYLNYSFTLNFAQLPTEYHNHMLNIISTYILPKFEANIPITLDAVTNRFFVNFRLISENKTYNYVIQNGFFGHLCFDDRRTRVNILTPIVLNFENCKIIRLEDISRPFNFGFLNSYVGIDTKEVLDWYNVQGCSSSGNNVVVIMDYQEEILYYLDFSVIDVKHTCLVELHEKYYNYGITIPKSIWNSII